jgi:hypothetical protein
VNFSFTAELWRYRGEAGWHFVTLPHGVADAIEELTVPTRRGFGSVRVEVTVGSTTWRTSLFPDTKAESYVLPVKKSVRTAERLEAGDDVAARIELVDG